MIGEPEEFFSIHFVQLTHDIFDSVIQSRHNDMLNSIYSSICGTDDFIQDCKRCLKRSKFHQCFNCLGIYFFRFDYLLTPSPQASEVEIFEKGTSSFPHIFVELSINNEPDPTVLSASNAGRTTPETFSCFAFTLKVACFACSCTRYAMSPVAYVTSAMEKDASCITRPIFLLA